MNWFYKWLYAKVSSAGREVESNIKIAQDTSATLVSSRHIDNHGMNFTVHRASGGYVIETRKYDRRKDENNQALHITTEDKDLGEEIGKIITFETLRS